MALTYTNRKGVTYTLYQTSGKDGKLHYAFGRQRVGEPVAELPPGFRISESPNGIVSLARDRPSPILPEEIAAVETELGRHPRAKNYRIVTKHKRIEVYAKEGSGVDVLDHYHERVAAGLAMPGREQQMLELDELYSRFAPVLCFPLLDPARRTFGGERVLSYWGADEWLDLGQTGSIAELARTLLPLLGTDAFAMDDDLVALTGAAEPNTAPGAGRTARSASKSSRSRPASVHQLKITLVRTKPPIWRRVVVPSDMTLGELHYVVQLAMGWDNSHLHDFWIGKTNYADPALLEDVGDNDEWEAPLAIVAPTPKTRIRYQYDFGDSWDHDILVEKVGPPAAGTRYPVCVAGARAGPPDDSGGVWGYAHLLETLADPNDPEHDMMMEWAGGPIDPEAFDVQEVNRRFARLG